MNNLFEIAASVSECCIIVRLCNKFLGFKKAEMIWGKSAIFLLLLCMQNILLSQLKGFEILSVVLLLLMIFGYSTFFLNGKIHEKILISILPTIAILLINQFIMIVFSAAAGWDPEAVKSGGVLRIPVLFFSKFAFFIVCEILMRLGKRGQYSLSPFLWTVQLLCFFSTFLIALMLWNISREFINIREKFFFIYIMIAVLNVLMYIMLSKMQYHSAEKEKQKISEINLASQEKFINEAREHYAKMRTLQHDMRHCLMTAARLISDNKAKEAKNYIEKVADEKVCFAPAGVDTGNVVIDAVINNKIAVCSDNNIEIKCLIDSYFEGISEIDISILLSNVLDNAIRGCTGVKEPKIELVIGTRMAFIYIIVKNSIPASVLADNPRLLTSKDDKAVHGFGIESMHRIAEKHGGSVTFREEQGNFIVEIWLTKSS